MIGVLILAGGRGQRMGGQDKGWCDYQQRPMITTVLAVLQTQMQSLTQPTVCVISANRNVQAYRRLGVAVVRDTHANFNGPLAGVEAALRWQKAHPAQPAIMRWITCPVDSMALPEDYLQRMAELPNHLFGYAQQGDSHYAHMSLPCSMSHMDETLDSLHTYVYGDAPNHQAWLKALPIAQRTGSIRGWLQQQNARAIHFTQPNAFLNINHLLGE
jgi:molybdopterin-guanine dinucleotide biosynthesis protein A